MLKKLMTLLFGAALIALPATALISVTAHASCYNPEFDAVGLDTANIFVDNVLAEIVYFQRNGEKAGLEDYSNFTKYSSGWIFNPAVQVNGASYPTAVPTGVPTVPFGVLSGGAHCLSSTGTALACQPAEFFAVAGTNATPVYDPCFGQGLPDQYYATNNALDAPNNYHYPYKSVFTPERSGAIYRWRIVLQQQPASDISISIEDCVLTETLNCPTGIFTTPSETGFYNLGPYLVFLQSALPSITAWAIPGPYASLGFSQPFPLYVRQQPQTSASLCPIQSLPFVSTAFFDESIVAAMPMTGGSAYGNFAQGYSLNGGDMIDISIGIPQTVNPNDYYFGQDNVLLKYIGVTGTGVYGSNECDAD